MQTVTVDVRHQPDRHRFVHAFEDGEEGYLEYRERDDSTLEYHHTFVPEEHRHQGIAGAVVERALAYARENGFEVVPTCPFVRSYIDDHPEAADVVASTG